MGLIFADARNLLESRRGKSGGRAVTLGRLTAYFHPSDLRGLRALAGADAAARRWLDAYRWGDYADGFFTDVLRFDSLDSVDFSDYEAATIIHDLGEPLPDALLGKFDLAVDGGTLEHVFNFPVAIGNLMQLVGPGGSVYLSGPCNNLCGHGFYQFSPELMYRVFSPSNGFEVDFVRVASARNLSVELTSGHRLYDVRDPDEARERVMLMSSTPVMIMAMARRVAVLEPFRLKVLQSDYVSTWAGVAARAPGRLAGVKAAIRRVVPGRWLDAAVDFGLVRKASLRRGEHFRRVR